MSIDEQVMPRESTSHWPREPEWLQRADDRAAAPAEARGSRRSEAVIDHDELRRAAIAHADDDAPRHAYGWGLVDIETVIERPIALDAQVMARRAGPTRPDRRGP